MLNRLYGRPGDRTDKRWRIESPGIERGVAEILIERTMKSIGAALQIKILHALALINRGVAGGLDLQLIDCIHRNCRPDKPIVTLLRDIKKWNALDIYGRRAAFTSRSVNRACVVGQVIVGFIVLHARHEKHIIAGAA